MSELDLRGLNYLTNGIHHQVLQSLAGGPLSTEALWGLLEHPLKRLISSADFVTDCLAVLSQEGHVNYLDASLWELTTNGHAMVHFLDGKSRRAAVSKLSVATNHSTKPSHLHYQGEELKSTVVRKGAYDFLALPSRYGKDEYVMHPTWYLSKGETSCLTSENSPQS